MVKEKARLAFKELYEKRFLSIQEVLEVLGYKIVEHEKTDVFKETESVYFGEDKDLIGCDEVITIKKEHR